MAFPPRSWSNDFVGLFSICRSGQTFGWDCSEFLFNKEIRSEILLQMTLNQLESLLLFLSSQWHNAFGRTVLIGSGLKYRLLDSLSNELSCLRNCLVLPIGLVSPVFHYLLTRFPNVCFLSFVVELVYYCLYLDRLSLLRPFWHASAIKIPLKFTLCRWNPLLGSIDCGLRFFLKHSTLLSLVIEEICGVLGYLRGVLLKRLFKRTCNTVLMPHHLREILVDGIIPYSRISGMCRVRTGLLQICGAEIFVVRLLMCLFFFLLEKLVWNVTPSFFVPWLYWKGRSWW